MIELFTHGSPNGHKISIALEELALPYRVTPVNVFAGEGHRPEFLRLNPTGKIPVIRDLDEGAVVSESGAILLYLADKARRLVPASGLQRVRATELLFLQAALQGPMFGQRMHFSFFAPEVVPYAIRRYEQQGEIIDALVDHLLTDNPYFLGDEYSIVDIAFFSWYHPAQRAGYAFGQHQHLAAWFERVAARPAVQRGLSIPSELPPLPARNSP